MQTVGDGIAVIEPSIQVPLQSIQVPLQSTIRQSSTPISTKALVHTVKFIEMWGECQLIHTAVSDRVFFKEFSRQIENQSKCFHVIPARIPHGAPTPLRLTNTLRHSNCIYYTECDVYQYSKFCYHWNVITILRSYWSIKCDVTL